MFCGVDGSCDVQSVGLEDINCTCWDIEPHALCEDVDGRVVDCHGIEDTASLVDFEEAVDDGVDLDGAEECAGDGWVGD